jgi:hypothetical protein
MKSETLLLKYPRNTIQSRVSLRNTPEDSQKCNVFANVSAGASRNMVYNIPEQNGYLWNVVDKCLYKTARNGTWLINWP